ncbi:MAG: hypothetical protein D6675_14565 [Gemmatimonadetes bacterium]|nr:MAG: hypothetical protein D6675_14565 [Gemmatimonadota bacterium]
MFRKPIIIMLVTASLLLLKGLPGMAEDFVDLTKPVIAYDASEVQTILAEVKTQLLQNKDVTPHDVYNIMMPLVNYIDLDIFSQGKSVTLYGQNMIDFIQRQLKRGRSSVDIGLLVLEQFKQTGFISGSSSASFFYTGDLTVASNVISENRKQPVSVTAITSKQIELSGARTVSELLTIFVPGFFLVEDSDDLISAFRGLSPDNNSKVLFQVNGHTINTEWFWGPPDALLNSLDMSYIDRIEVIRGPGSVTLGQGALLGVINIVTKNHLSAPSNQSTFRAALGLDRYHHGSFENFNSTVLSKGELGTYVYLGFSEYHGQKQKNKGWTTIERQGLKVSERGYRIKRGDNSTFLVNLGYNKLKFNVMYVDQYRDNYNFFRDREKVQQTLLSIFNSYTHNISAKLGFKVNLTYERDEYLLHSNSGLRMGGTREDRYGTKILFTSNGWINKHRSALGFEFKQYVSGQKNRYGNNFILNIEDSLSAWANERYTYVYPNTLNMYSFVAEDYYTILPAVDAFAAMRYDHHPHWGNNLTPRLGVLYEAMPGLNFRLSWQTGFRGAVSLNYSGGFRLDGYLRDENHNRIEAYQIPTFTPVFSVENPDSILYYYVNTHPDSVQQNVGKTLPEKMANYELAVQYKPNPQLTLDVVGYYNILDQILDVGIISVPSGEIVNQFGDTVVYEMPDIGSDVAGDWNGYWFYKNNKGRIKTFGYEASVIYETHRMNATLSHSMTKVLNAPESQTGSGGSMYLIPGNTSGKHFRAYPEHVTRLQCFAFPFTQWAFSLNYLYYWQWYTPSGKPIESNHLVNVGIKYQWGSNLEIMGTLKNVLNDQKLYPMNANAGDEDESRTVGTPSVEKRTFWFNLRYTF